MNTEPIIKYFSNILPLEAEEIYALESVLKERTIKRRQFILQETDVCTQNTFVVEGCFRMYYIDVQGKEHNLQFAIENCQFQIAELQRRCATLVLAPPAPSP